MKASQVVTATRLRNRAQGCRRGYPGVKLSIRRNPDGVVDYFNARVPNVTAERQHWALFRNRFAVMGICFLP